MVDFNNLTADQKIAVSAITPTSLLNALGGDDTIILPDDLHSSNLVPSATVPVVFKLNDPAATFHGGDGADTFDFTKDQGLNGYTTGETLYIDGDTPTKGASAIAPYSTPTLDDTLKLPGSPSDYTFAVNYTSTLAGTHTVVSRNSVTSAGPATPVNINTVDIERVIFSNPLINIVTPTAGNNLAEMAQLDDEVYGPLKTLKNLDGTLHTAEILASAPNASPAQTTNVSLAAQGRGWHPLSAMDLGIAPADFGQGLNGLQYAFAGGLYQALDPTLSIGGDHPEADALLLAGVVSGQKTVAISFRGTDQYADFADYGDFGAHYAMFKPVLDALDAYIIANGIQQVLVSGHSLGGAMTQLYMASHAGDARFQALTIGSPGAENVTPVNPTPDKRIVNFSNTDDLVARVSGNQILFDPNVAGLAAGLLDLFGSKFGASSSEVSQLKPMLASAQAKTRQGSNIQLNSEVASSLGVVEHNRKLYGAEIQKLLVYAGDSASAFIGSQLATSLSAGNVYSGPSIQIGLEGYALPLEKFGFSGSTMRVDSHDSYVLGDIAQNDFITWDGSGAGALTRAIDGGGGIGVSGKGDTLDLTGRSNLLTGPNVWTWNRNGNHYDLYKQNLFSGKINAGTFRRIDTVVTFAGSYTGLAQDQASSANTAALQTQATQGSTFLADTAALDPASVVTHLNGTPTSVQRAQSGAMTLVADGTSDVTYAQAGVASLSSSADHAVLVYGPDTAHVAVTGGQATIASDGSPGGTVNIDTGNTPSVVVGSARTQVIVGHLAGATFEGGSGDSTVTYAAARSAYTLTSAADGSMTVSDTAGTGGDHLVGIQHLAFADQTVDITTTPLPDPAPSFAMTDVTASISSTAAGEDYSGPLSYLQKQFIYTGADQAAVAAQTSNVFLKGSTGDDALAASGGSNVLDGGLGSNFLVGASGADQGTDTFFIDGRSAGVTWSTVVNFHHGDAVTLWGFVDGTSTMPWTALDGAQGYQGATIHAELAGAGSGVNASVTFANVSLADAQNKLITSTGNVSGNSYLSITYTG